MRISDWSSDVCSSDLSAAAAGIGAHRVLQRAEALAEGDLAFVVEALAAEQQDGVFLERRTDRRERRVVHGPAGVDADDLRAVERVELADLEHGRTAPRMRWGCLHRQIGRASRRERVCQ